LNLNNRKRKKKIYESPICPKKFLLFGKILHKKVDFAMDGEDGSSADVEMV